MPPTDSLNTFPKNQFYAARAFVIMTAIISFLALAMLFVDRCIPYVMWVLIASSVAAFIAIMLWTTALLNINVGQGSHAQFKLGYSGWLFIGSILLMVAAIVYEKFGSHN
jgi:hypothetical protein